jgi:hypothetical protein
MADPHIDEDLMVDLIATNLAPDTVRRLMAGAIMLLLDAYDRKVTRDNFCQIASGAVALHSYAAQYGCIVLARALSRSGDLTEQKLTDSVETLRRLTEDGAEASIIHARNLRECPWSDDAVH